MTSFRSFIALFSLALGSVLATCLIFELFCRIVVDDGMHYHLEMWKYATSLKEFADDSAIGHQHVPGSQARLMGVDVNINANGLRDAPFDASAESLRILMLGDSVTFGWGVPHSETVAERLEQDLKKHLNMPVDVINAGVGNYNTSMEVAWFFEQGMAYKPDVIVLNVFVNDAEMTPEYSPVSMWDRFLYSRVILFGAIDTVARTLFGGLEWDAYYQGLYEDSAPGWLAMQAAFGQLANFCRDNDIPLVLVDYPELRELNPYPFSGVSIKLDDMAQAQGVKYVSLLPAVQAEDPMTLWVTQPDPHPNARAAKLMSDYFEPRLTELMNINAIIAP